MTVEGPSSKPNRTTLAELVDQLWKSLPQALWIVTACGDERDAGLLATWVMPASLDSRQARMLVSLAVNHATCQAVLQAGGFVLHWLDGNNEQLAYRFASASSREVDKFSGLALDRTEGGHPLLHEAAGWLVCRTVAHVSAGDRILFWGEVVGGARNRLTPPLTADAWFGRLTAQQRATLEAQRQRDAQLHQPLYEAWKAARERGPAVDGESTLRSKTDE